MTYFQVHAITTTISKQTNGKNIDIDPKDYVDIDFNGQDGFMIIKKQNHIHGIMQMTMIAVMATLMIIRNSYKASRFSFNLAQMSNEVLKGKIVELNKNIDYLQNEVDDMKSKNDHWKSIVELQTKELVESKNILTDETKRINNIALNLEQLTKSE